MFRTTRELFLPVAVSQCPPSRRRSQTAPRQQFRGDRQQSPLRTMLHSPFLPNPYLSPLERYGKCHTPSPGNKSPSTSGHFSVILCIYVSHDVDEYFCQRSSSHSFKRWQHGEDRSDANKLACSVACFDSIESLFRKCMIRIEMLMSSSQGLPLSYSSKAFLQMGQDLRSSISSSDSFTHRLNEK